MIQATPVQHDLGWWANVASVATLVVTLLGTAVGIYGYLKYRFDFWKKSKRLEDYLRKEKEKGNDQGQRSSLRIVRDVGLTEDEIIKISFSNPRIVRRVDKDEL